MQAVAVVVPITLLVVLVVLAEVLLDPILVVHFLIMHYIIQAAEAVEVAAQILLVVVLTAVQE
jgi:hypothetical protein